MRSLLATCLILSHFQIACSSSNKYDYKNADWYKSSKRTYSLQNQNFEDDFSESDRKLATMKELTLTAGLRSVVGECPVRKAPNDQAEILRRTSSGERLPTRDNGGEWFRIEQQSENSFVHKSCFRDS